MHNLTLRSMSKLEAALGETIICVPELASRSFDKTRVLLPRRFSEKGASCRLSYFIIIPQTFIDLK